MARTITLAGQDILRLGLGTYNFGIQARKADSEIALLHRALDLGVALIDTATMYDNEAFLGQALRDMRQRVFLVSKVLPSQASFNGVIRACERSLRDLKTDHLDLYMLHWASSYPLEQTVAALKALKAQGKILSYGLSNIDVPEIKALGTEVSDLTALEVLYNPSARGIEYDMLPFAHERQIAVIAYSPLGSGSASLLHHPTIERIARRHQVSTAQILIAFSLRDDSLISIPKASSLPHLADNIKALDVVLDDEDKQLLDSAFPPATHKVPLKLGW